MKGAMRIRPLDFLRGGGNGGGGNNTLLRNQKQRPTCTMCIRGKEAVKECSTCEKLLCTVCEDHHRYSVKTAEHQLTDVTPQSNENIIPRCKNHVNNEITHFCIKCNEIICEECFRGRSRHEGNNHQLVLIKEAVPVFSENVKGIGKEMNKILTDLRSRCTQIKTRLEDLRTRERIQLVQQVQCMFSSLISRIYQREREICEDIAVKMAEAEHVLQMKENEYTTRARSVLQYARVVKALTQNKQEYPTEDWLQAVNLAIREFPLQQKMMSKFSAGGDDYFELPGMKVDKGASTVIEKEIPNLAKIIFIQKRQGRLILPSSQKPEEIIRPVTQEQPVVLKSVPYAVTKPPNVVVLPKGPQGKGTIILPQKSPIVMAIKKEREFPPDPLAFDNDEDSQDTTPFIIEEVVEEEDDEGEEEATMPIHMPKIAKQVEAQKKKIAEINKSISEELDNVEVVEEIDLSSEEGLKRLRAYKAGRNNEEDEAVITSNTEENSCSEEEILPHLEQEAPIVKEKQPRKPQIILRECSSPQLEVAPSPSVPPVVSSKKKSSRKSQLMLRECQDDNPSGEFQPEKTTEDKGKGKSAPTTKGRRPSNTSISSGSTRSPEDQYQQRPGKRSIKRKTLDPEFVSTFDDRTHPKRKKTERSSGGSTASKKKEKEKEAIMATPKPSVTNEKPEGNNVLKTTYDSDHEDYCALCRDGGSELLCCDTCPKIFHPECHIPTIKGVPEGDFNCNFCSTILTPMEKQSRDPSAGGIHEDEDEFLRACKFLSKVFKVENELNFRWKVEKVQDENTSKSATPNATAASLLFPLRHRLADNKPRPFSSANEMLEDLDKLFRRYSDKYKEQEESMGLIKKFEGRIFGDGSSKGIVGDWYPGWRRKDKKK